MLLVFFHCQLIFALIIYIITEQTTIDLSQLVRNLNPATSKLSKLLPDREKACSDLRTLACAMDEGSLERVRRVSAGDLMG
jgi:hypothetical protein